MNYKVLYRKYRPNDFDSIIGQKTVVSLLKESIVENKISHAYIFSGPRGTGKTSSAKIFAKAVNCLNINNGNPCNECEICKNINSNSDIYEIDAASNNGVDQIREIIDNIKLAPVNSKYKVYIIDEVHMLSTSAFNALLLTLEEPPSHVIFILATTNIEDVPITVLSRCQRLDFKKLSTNDIISNLKEISKKEKINITDEALNEIAELSDGGMRDALSLLDQLSKTNDKITEDIVLNNIGLVSNKKIEELVNDINDSKIDKIIEFINFIKENASDFKTVVKKIINVLTKEAIKIIEGTSNSILTYDEIKKLCFELANLLYKSNVHVDSYTLLELTLLGYVKKDLPVKKQKNEEVISTKNDSTTDKNETIIEKKDDNYLKNLALVRINNCFVNADKKYKQEMINKWQEFINKIRDKKYKGMLLDTELVLASNEIIVIKADLIENVLNINSNIEIIEQKYNKEYNLKYKIIAVDNNLWQEEMNKYIENHKNGIKYEKKDEPIKNNDIIVEGIFSKEKIEIK